MISGGNPLQPNHQGASSQMKKTAATGQQIDARELLARVFVRCPAAKLDEASTCCKLVLTRQPELAPAHFVGLIAWPRGPASPPARSVPSPRSNPATPPPGRIWALLAEGGQVNCADVALQSAVSCESGDIPAIHDVIGTTYTLLGEHRTADEWFRCAAAAEPGNPAFRINYANNLVYLWRDCTGSH